MIDNIFKEVLSEMGLMKYKSQIMRSRGSSIMSNAKALTFYILSDKYSIAEIAKYFNMNRASIYYAIKSIRNTIEQDEVYEIWLIRITNKIKDKYG